MPFRAAPTLQLLAEPPRRIRDQPATQRASVFLDMSFCPQHRTLTSPMVSFDSANASAHVTKPRQLGRQQESSGHTHPPAAPSEYERAQLLADCILLFFFLYDFSFITLPGSLLFTFILEL